MVRYFVYIIYSLTDFRYYTGLTNDLVRRMKEHNRGSNGTPSTLNRGPFILVHAEESQSLIKARSREKYWKSGEGRELRDMIVSKIIKGD